MVSFEHTKRDYVQKEIIKKGDAVDKFHVGNKLVFFLTGLRQNSPLIAVNLIY